MITSIGKDLSHAQSLLEAGQLVAIPTETVYGLAANALNPKAVTQIFEVKQRPSFDPLIVHVANLARCEEWVTHIPSVFYTLAEAFCPGAITFLMQKKDRIPDIVTSGLPTVGIRIPDHALTLELLEGLDFPLAAPSANPFGYVSPTTSAHVANQLSSKIPYILEGGSCRIGIESTIVGMDTDQLVIHRLGGLSVEEIAQVSGLEPIVKAISTSNPKSPGQLLSHYAPKAPLIIGDWVPLLDQYEQHKVAMIVFGELIEDFPSSQQFNLSPAQDVTEAAHRLFAILREIDMSDYEVISARLLPDHGLGRAINDRLRRASATIQ